MKLSKAEVVVVGLMIIGILYVMISNVGMGGGEKRFVVNWNYVGTWIVVIALIGTGLILTIRARRRKVDK